MNKKILTKIILILTIATTLQSCGRKGPLKLPNDEKNSWQEENQDMYE